MSGLCELADPLVLWEATENSFQTMLGKVQFCFVFLMCFRHTQQGLSFFPLK